MLGKKAYDLGMTQLSIQGILGAPFGPCEPFLLVCLGATPGSAEGFLLALCSEITSGSAQGTLQSAGGMEPG